MEWGTEYVVGSDGRWIHISKIDDGASGEVHMVVKHLAPAFNGRSAAQLIIGFAVDLASI